MRIAILISGEYRKFDVTRRTMTFLDNPNIDVYVSTWDKTVFSSKRIGLYVEETITKEKIMQDLNRNAVIRIDHHNKISIKAKYNIKMIDRWLVGFDLIKDSGIEYDYVIIIRPDLFFDTHPIDLTCLERYSDSIAFAWATSLHLRKLPDVLFASTFKNMKLLFDSLSIEGWNNDVQHDWHIWWFEFVNKLFPNIYDARDFSYIAFCRYWVRSEHTYSEVIALQHDWKDLHLLAQCDLFGKDFARGIWAENTLQNAEDKWNSGYFERYK